MAGWMWAEGSRRGRSEEAAREVTIKIRRRSCFVAAVGTAGREGGGREVRSTTGVKVRRERRRKRGQRDREGKGEEGEQGGEGVRSGGRWSRVRNETILSSRGREGRCERVGVVFSPLRRLTSLRRGEGGSESGADFGRALLSRWGPRDSVLLRESREEGNR